MIAAAEKWVGYLEHQSNDRLGFYCENVGKGGCTIFSMIIARHYRWRNFSGLPWCATFVHAVALEAWGKERARRLLGKPQAGTRALVRRLRRRGMLLGREAIPEPGDILFCQNGDGKVSHCGIVKAVVGDTVVSIEGNTVDPSGFFAPEQGGAVAVRCRSRSDPAIFYYGRIRQYGSDDMDICKTPLRRPAGLRRHGYRGSGHSL